MSFKEALSSFSDQCLTFFEQTIGKTNNGRVKIKKEDFWQNGLNFDRKQRTCLVIK